MEDVCVFMTFHGTHTFSSPRTDEHKMTKNTLLPTSEKCLPKIICARLQYHILFNLNIEYVVLL